MNVLEPELFIHEVRARLEARGLDGGIMADAALAQFQAHGLTPEETARFLETCLCDQTLSCRLRKAGFYRGVCDGDDRV
jgi:hypothetical protein